MDNPGDPDVTAVKSGQRQQNGNPDYGQVPNGNTGPTGQRQRDGSSVENTGPTGQRQRDGSSVDNTEPSGQRQRDGSSVDNTEPSGQRQRDVSSDEPGNEQVSDRNIGESEQRQLDDIPKEKYSFDEVNPERIDQVFNICQLRDIALVRVAATNINDEPSSVKKNLTLRIKSYMPDNSPGQRAKYIEVISGGGENCIECYYDNEQNVVWRYTSKVKSGALRWLYEKMQFITEFAINAATMLSSVESVRYLVAPAWTWVSRSLTHVRLLLLRQ